MSEPPLVSCAGVKRALEAHGLTAKKQLGQNFLIDPFVVQKIMAAAEVGPGDHVLEIGPGLGGLTQSLCAAAGHVTAVELDRQLIPALEEELAGCGNLTVVQGDILEMDAAALLKAKPGLTPKIAANLPFYVTTPILMDLLEKRVPAVSITVMIQKEAARRFAAGRPGSKAYGAVTCAASYFADAYLAANVPSHCFYPRPNVDSAVLKLTPLTEPRAAVRDEELLFQVIKAAFGNRRKTLVNCLYTLFPGRGKKELQRAIESCGLPAEVRGEALGIEEFARVTEELIGDRMPETGKTV